MNRSTPVALLGLGLTSLLILFDAELENIIWNVETSSGFKLAQFRVYSTGN